MTVERIPPQAARRQLAELQRRRFALRTAAGAMEFDAATLAAPGNRYARACALAVLNEDRLALTSSAEGIRLMDSLEACAGELDEAEKRELRLLLREGAMQRAVNQEEYCAFRKLAGDTAPAWERAKALNDFSYVEEPLGRLAAIMGVKVVIGMAVGLVVDVALRAWHRAGDGHLHIHELCERERCHCDDDHDHDHGHGDGSWAIVRSALVHTVQVTLFILALTFVFGLVIESVGQDALAALLANHPVRAVFVSALVGLVPNCGASVAITELYLDGVLATGPMLAGLLASGGVGLLVLWRTNADARQNALVTAFVYLVAVAVGLLVAASGILL